MKVVLRADISGVGRRGDIVEVAGGFARNFLLPEGAAIMASEGIEAQATAMRRSRDLRDARDREAGQAKATVLAGATVTVPARAGASGRLFGSVSGADVVNAVRAQLGVELERQNIGLEEAIKEVGTTEVTVTLHHDVVTIFNIEVVAEQG